MPQHQLTIGLLKPGAWAEDVAPTLSKYAAHAIEVKGRAVGTLYLPPASKGPMRWAAWFSTADDNPVAGRIQVLHSGLLHVRVSQRDFVVPFGMSGRHAVPLDALEEHFGRNVTLNTVDPDRLRVIDNVRVEAEARQSRVQLGRAGAFLAFALDPEQDLVRSIGGEPRDASFGSRVQGATYLALTSDTTLATLKAKLRRCLALFESDAYKEDFDYLDALAPVRDPARVERLTAAAVARVADDRAPGQAWLAVPEIIDWSDGIEGFAFRPKPKPEDIQPDVFIGRFRQHVGDRPIDERLLRTRHVHVIRTDGAPGGKWSVFRCLYAEIEESDTVYVLTESKWYAVHRSLVEKVSAFMRTVPKCSVTLAPWAAKKTEAHFNGATAALDPTTRHNMDGHHVPFGGPHQKIEVCDVLCDGRVLIHAKKYTSSKPLSHLFAQGANSAELLLDEDFLDEARKKFAFLEKPWRAHGKEVAFVVGSHSTKELDLPFFSRVTLRAVAQRLRRLGYGVSLSRVTIA